MTVVYSQECLFSDIILCMVAIMRYMYMQTEFVYVVISECLICNFASNSVCKHHTLGHG